MILLNDILNFTDLNKVKLRFNINFGNNLPPISYFIGQTTSDINKMLEGQYWNSAKKKWYRNGDITLGFVPVPLRKDCWLLFHIGQVTKDLNVNNGVGYEYRVITNYDKYVGRIIVSFKNTNQNLIRIGSKAMPQCEVVEILPQKYNNDFFPGYDKVNVSWKELNMLIKKPSWITALGNQKGVYLLVDRNNGKKYVGSAYGNNMLLGRWQTYINDPTGGNKLLKKLSKDYIKNNFFFSILETFNHNVDDKVIIDRETYWKEVLMTRKFGYNDN